MSFLNWKFRTHKCLLDSLYLPRSALYFLDRDLLLPFPCRILWPSSSKHCTICPFHLTDFVALCMAMPWPLSRLETIFLFNISTNNIWPQIQVGPRILSSSNQKGSQVNHDHVEIVQKCILGEWVTMFFMCDFVHKCCVYKKSHVSCWWWYLITFRTC